MRTLALLCFSFLLPLTSLAAASGRSIDGEGAELIKYEFSEAIRSQQRVKFSVLLNVRQEPVELVFQNTNRYAFHSDYLLTRPEFRGWTRARIDEAALKAGPGRRLVLGTLFSHYFLPDEPASQFTHSFEIVASDLTAAPLVAKVKELLARSSPKTLAAAKLGYLAAGPMRSAILEQRPELERAGVRVLDPFTGVKTQAYVQGWNVGVVLVAKAAELPALIKAGKVSERTILVVDTVPREIPPVAGIVSAEPTAPSSHVALLAGMFQIPFAYDAEALNKAEGLQGKPALVKVTALGLRRLDAIEPALLERLAPAKKLPALRVVADFTPAALVPAERLFDKDIPAYGGKSVRLGLLVRTVPAAAPKGTIAIPLHWFRRYLREAGLEAFVAERLGRIRRGGLHFGEISGELAVLREKLKATPVPATIVEELRASLRKAFPGESVRLKLRSSSNVEDGAEFNGAGLYDSEGVWLTGAPRGKENDFERGLNKVWRSLYSDRGYLARSRFLVDEEQVGMGILAHRPYKGELANGVAVLRPQEESWASPTAEITGFPGEEDTVTNPGGPTVPETTLVRGTADDMSTELRQACSLLPVGRTLLAEGEYKSLARLLHIVAKTWPGGMPKSGLDFEWKLMEDASGKRSLVVKQVRAMPLKREERLPDGSRFFFFGAAQELELNYPEMDAAFGQLYCPEKIKVTFPSFSEQELEKDVLLPRVELELRGRKYDLTNIKARLQKPKDEHSSFHLELTVPTALSPAGHRLAFSNNFYGSYTPSFLLDDASGTVKGDEKAYRAALPFYPNIDSYACYLREPVDYGAERHLPPGYRDLVHQRLKAADGTIEFEGEYKPRTGMDKTSHYILSKATVKGFGAKRAFTVTVPRGAVYAGEHHNFGWGFALDVEATDLSAEEKAAFEKRNGRFFLFTTNRSGEGAWLKRDGKLGPKFKVEAESLRRP